MAQTQNVSAEDYDRYLGHLRKVARDRGAESVFQEYGADVIIGPADGPLPSIAACGGTLDILFPMTFLLMVGT